MASPIHASTPPPPSRFRIARWLLAAAFLPALYACNNRRLAAPAGPPDQETEHLFDLANTKKLDILFMVDNSSSMGPMQENVGRNIPAFMNVLKAVPSGLPDVHIGVISSSLGAGAFTDVPGCPPGGDRGVMQNTPRLRADGSTCSKVPRDHYIISAEKGTKNNFDGDISEVFECIANLGDSGCGFEHQLASIKRALGGDPTGAPAENEGFLRPDAILAVVMLTNEDDCSAPPDSDLFDTSQSSLSDPLGKLGNFRCNEFGHLCGGQRPPRTPVSNLQGCEPAEEAGKLVPVHEYVSFLKALKKNPNNVLVAAIAASPEPYSVGQDGTGAPEIVHSCTGQGSFGDPAVRIHAFVDAFGKNGTFYSICSGEYAPALDAIARRAVAPIGPKCLDALLVDANPDLDGLQPSCAVVDQVPMSDGSMREVPLPSCEVGAPPCWRLRANPSDCTLSGFEIQIDHGGEPPAGSFASVSCATCLDTNDPRCRI